MNGFSSYQAAFEELLMQIVPVPQLHAKWINTLSFLENCGARKIAACEHPQEVDEEMLKHAAEEFRHAFHLKKQSRKIGTTLLQTYSRESILGGNHTRHYLAKLEVTLCKMVLESRGTLNGEAYYLVTYAIEARSLELYAVYESVLRRLHSSLSVRALLAEEVEHLNEMRIRLLGFAEGPDWIRNASRFESSLCERWLAAIENEIKFSLARLC